MIATTESRNTCRLNPLHILLFDCLDTILPLLQIFGVEGAVLVREVLLLDAFADDAFVLIVHAEAWHVGVVVRPLVAFCCSSGGGILSALLLQVPNSDQLGLLVEAILGLRWPNSPRLKLRTLRYIVVCDDRV